ncbi:flagellar basal body rod protein FlgB [Acidithrix ferrooxidans]|nr:flagellar basal body protein [Acidithrix ferrooxidans]
MKDFGEYLMGGPVVQALQFALDGLTIQQNVQANNIANVSTPGFTASRVDFASSLQSALASSTSGAPAVASVAITGSSRLPSTNGNNVSMSQELVGIEKSTVWYQSASAEINNQYHLMRGSAGGSY